MPETPASEGPSAVPIGVGLHPPCEFVLFSLPELRFSLPELRSLLSDACPGAAPGSLLSAA